VPAGVTDEQLKERALQLNELTTTKAMDEKLVEVGKQKDVAKRLVKIAEKMHKDAKGNDKPFKFNAAIVLGKAAQNVKEYSIADTFYSFSVDNALKLQSGSKLALAYSSLLDLKWDQKEYAEVEALAMKMLESDIPGKEMDGAKSLGIERMIQAKALRGDTDEALRIVNNLMALDKNGWYALTLKGFVQRQARKYDDAIETYNEVLARVAKDEKLDEKIKKNVTLNTRYLLTGVYVDNNKVEKAAELLQGLIKDEPDSATYYNDLGFIWADNDMKLEESEKLIRKALELDEKARKKLLEEGKIDKTTADQANAAYLDSLGWVLYKNKKYKEAKKNLMEAVKDDDEGAHLEIWDHLADTHVALGETKEAVDIWLKALKFEDVSKRDAERRKKITEKLNKARAELKKKEAK